MQAHRLTLNQFQAEAGVPGERRLRKWFHERGRAIDGAVIELLAELVGIPTDQAIAEAGGETAQEQAARRGRELQAKYLTNLSPDARERGQRKGAAARTGKTRSAEAVAKSLATKALNGAQDRFMAAGWAKKQTVEGRAVSMLYGRLRWPETITPEMIRRWENEAAEALETNISAIRTIWRPYLRKRGLLGAGGRPVQAERCKIAAEEWAAGAPSRRQRGPDAYWSRVARRVTESEQPEHPYTGEEMRNWAKNHANHERCPLVTARSS